MQWNRAEQKKSSDLMALVRRAYLVWLDTFGTCLDPRRRPHFHSNHPVWLGLAEACHTTITHICIKSKKQVLKMRITCFCMHACLRARRVCTLARADFVSAFISVCECVYLCVCVYLSGRTEWTRHIWDWLVEGGHKHWVSRTTMNLLACLIKSLG